MDKLNQSLNTLYQKIEQFQLKRELLTRYHKNLELLKKVSPRTYEIIRHLDQNEFQLGMDAERQINVYDLRSKYQIYPNAAKKFCEEQVTAYCQQSLRFYTQFTDPYPESDFYRYASYCNKIIALINEESTGYQGNLELPIGIAMIGGIGLGYHIPLLLERLDINHLCILEESYEMFQLSLYTTDWTEIFNQFSKQGKSLNLLIDRSSDDLFDVVQGIVKTHGLQVVTNCIYYNHLTSNRYDHALQLMKNRFGLLNIAFGSFEDEFVSLNHSLMNFKQTRPVFNGKACTDIDDLPIYLIGSGPSLDDALSYIKQTAAQAVIVSCGTALKPLLEAGITPDFHIQNERTSVTAQAIKEIDQAEIIKKIKLIALNGVPPEVLTQFEQTYIALKNNDTGAATIKSLMTTLVEPLANAFPTVVNVALDISIRLGFKQIHLFGADLATVSNKHHANETVYYDAESSVPNYVHQCHIDTLNKHNKPIKTSEIFLYAKMTIERTVALNKNVNIYNYSNGLVIQGCIDKTISEAPSLKSDSDINKNSIIDQIISQSFDPISLTIQDNCSDYIGGLSKWISQMKKDIFNVRIPRHQLIISWTNLINELENDAELSDAEKLIINSSIHLFGMFIISYLYSTTIETEEEYTSKYQLMMHYLDDYFSDIENYINQPIKAIVTK